MQISVVSRFWPSNERSGVTLAAAEHVRMLAEDGHEVSIIGSHAAILNERLPAKERFHVPARGSGALYSPAHLDHYLLSNSLQRAKPELVIVETWQTALTDAAVKAAHAMGVPVLMVSHGVSVHPFTSSVTDIAKSLAWIPYRWKNLPRNIGRLSAITTLDETSPSKRFHDRDLARRMGVPVVPMRNAPVNWTDRAPDRNQRKPQILVMGYYSPIKNQLGALKVLAGLPPDLHVRFIGRREGHYYERCRQAASQAGLDARVSFMEDHECDLAHEIAHSLVVLSTSTTEALPLTLLEAMACGTPFVATPVGAVLSLKGGIVAASTSAQQNAILKLQTDAPYWQKLRAEGQEHFQREFTRDRIKDSLRQAVATSLQDRRPRAHQPFAEA